MMDRGGGDRSGAWGRDCRGRVESGPDRVAGNGKAGSHTRCDPAFAGREGLYSAVSLFSGRMMTSVSLPSDRIRAAICWICSVVMLWRIRS